MKLIEWFEKGLSVEEYIAQMTTNKEDFEHVYQEFSLTDAEKERLNSLSGKIEKVIVLTEDWCGDALLNNPVLVRTAEETNMEVRFLLRDQNLELMDQYLTNGKSRSIPIFIFLDKAGEEQAVWGPRAKEIQEMVDEEVGKLPAKDDPTFNEKQQTMFKKFKSTYIDQPEIRHVVAKSIIETLR